MGNRGSLCIREVHIGYLIDSSGRNRGDWLYYPRLLKNRLDSIVVHRANGFGNYHLLRLCAVGLQRPREMSFAHRVSGSFLVPGGLLEYTG